MSAVMTRVRCARLDSGQVAELIRDRNTGDRVFVIDDRSRDPHLIAEAINDLLRKEEEAQRRDSGGPPPSV